MQRYLTLLIWTAAWAMLTPPGCASAGEKQVPPATNSARFREMELRIPETTVKFTMVKLPAGKIDLAIPNQAPKTIDLKSFWIGRTEVTWDEYDVFAMGLDIKSAAELMTAASKTIPGRPYGDPGYGHHSTGYPAMSIHPQSAEAYCKWLSKKFNKKFRLPTEAEWEYACRAGEQPVILPVDALDKVAWYEDNSAAPNGDPEVHPVAQKAANPWGLYDTLGNVAEWSVADNGASFTRGGSYKDTAAQVHCRARIPYDDAVLRRNDPENPKNRWWLSDGPHVGFRMVMEE